MEKDERINLKGKTISVLDKGYVRLIDFLGNDQRIVEAARVSYQSPSKGIEHDKKLLNYLYRNAHTSPFEQCNITYNIKMPIFVMRQFVRHRTFRLNEMSARYTELPDEFYIPSKWRAQDTKDKQNSLFNGDLDFEKQNGRLSLICNTSFELYKAMIGDGVAREMARMILPVNIYTEIYVNCDIHNLIHFLGLRLDTHAQWEMRQYAKAMHQIFTELFPWSSEAFTEQFIKDGKILEE